MSSNVTKVKATIAELVAAFPAAFTLEPALVRPVKLGIRNDLYAQSAISRRRITAALRSYCNNVHYLKASTEGAVRTGDTIHQFFQMYQQMDCAIDAEHVTKNNPTGCLHDLQSAVTTTYVAPSHDTGQTMEFFNMQRGMRRTSNPSPTNTP